MPLRVVVQGDLPLVEALSEKTEQLILSPVETSLEISARVSQADVLVIDLTHDTDAALLAMRTLQLKRPMLALAHKDQVRAALDAGAAGVVARDTPPEAIAAAIGALHRGLSVMTKGYAEGPAPVAPPAPSHLSVLTPREREVLTHLAEGLSNKEIAHELTISEHTAKFHVNSILQKMGAQKRVEAVVRAARLGIIEL